MINIKFVRYIWDHEITTKLYEYILENPNDKDFLTFNHISILKNEIKSLISVKGHLTLTIFDFVFIY